MCPYFRLKCVCNSASLIRMRWCLGKGKRVAPKREAQRSHGMRDDEAILFQICLHAWDNGTRRDRGRGGSLWAGVRVRRGDRSGLANSRGEQAAIAVRTMIRCNFDQRLGQLRFRRQFGAISHRLGGFRHSLFTLLCRRTQPAHISNFRLCKMQKT